MLSHLGQATAVISSGELLYLLLHFTVKFSIGLCVFLWQLFPGFDFVFTYILNICVGVNCALHMSYP